MGRDLAVDLAIDLADGFDIKIAPRVDLYLHLRLGLK
jgi:hypothetical protein